LLARVAATFEANVALQDELIQEMSLAVWRAFDAGSFSHDEGFRGEASIKTYVARIAHNKAVDHVIKEQKRVEVSGAENVQYENAVSEGDCTEQTLDLMSALHKYRQVMALQLEGFNQNEIAQTLGLTESAVAKRASRARQQLSSLM
jgi:RNA polymerase sigma-70 factor (ECF subfamily)